MTQGSKKAAARTAQEIVQIIYDEGLRPGDHYLSEADALARHQVSRATFREALRFLEFQGVLRVRAGPGGGAIVAKPDWPHLASTFALLLQFADATLSAVMAARAVIEPAMAALAAQNATPDLVAEIGRELASAEAALADHPAFVGHYRAFWSAVARATGNPVTAMLWPALRALVDSGGFVPSEQYRAALTGRMRSLLDALSAGDADEAQRLVLTLDREFADRLAENYPRRVARRMAWTDVIPPR